MAFAQLTNRESLRDIEACLRSVGGKLYNLGVDGGEKAEKSYGSAARDGL